MLASSQPTTDTTGSLTPGLLSGKNTVKQRVSGMVADADPPSERYKRTIGFMVHASCFLYRRGYWLIYAKGDVKPDMQST